MKKRLLKLAVLLLVLIIPTVIFSLISEALPDPYKDTYLGAFRQKYQTLYETKGKKIVFIGGSGLPFGLRTDLLQKEIGDDYFDILEGFDQGAVPEGQTVMVGDVEFNK